MTDSWLGELKLVRRIARGGQAEVWEVQRGHERLAVKLLDASESESSSASRRLYSEARIGLLLDHPNIVRVCAFSAEPRPHLLMEFLQGRPFSSLAELAAVSPLPLGLVAGLMEQALEGLAWAHSRVTEELGHIVHRDLKPSNLFVTDAGVVKILDFGISTAQGLDRTLTRTGVVRGSLSYLPPEALQGKPVDQPGDVYSMALVFFELLTGKSYFDRGAEGLTVMAIVAEQVVPVTHLRADVPPAVAEILARGLSKSPEQRPATAGELLETLRPILKGMTAWAPADIALWLARHPAESIPPRRSTASFSGPPPDLSRSAPSSGSARSKRTILVFASAATLGLGSAAWYATAASRAPALAQPQPDVARSDDSGPAPLELDQPARPAPLKAEAEPLVRPAGADAGAPDLPRTVTGRDTIRAFGFATLESRPWSKVKIDGIDVGVTPLYEYRLAAGAHVVTMTSDKGTRRFTLRVLPGRHTVKKVDF